MPVNKIPIKVFIYGFFAFVFLGLSYYLLIGSQAKKLISKRLVTRQEIFAAAVSNNITTFLQTFGGSISVMSGLPSVKGQNEATDLALDKFVAEWGPTGLIGGIAVANSKGIVTHNSNITGTHDVGVSISDRDYFIWAMSQKEGEAPAYYVSKPVVAKFGGAKGETIVSVASPIFDKGKFAGVVSASVKLHVLAQRFLDNLRLGDNTTTFLIDDNVGHIVHSSDPNFERTDKNINEFVAGINDRFEASEEGQLSTVRYNIGFSKITLSGQNWVIIMATPTTEMAQYTVPIYVRGGILLVLVFVTLYIVSFQTVKEIGSQYTSESSLSKPQKSS